MAISGLIPAFPFTTLLRACRVTPRTFAPAVTDRPRGSRRGAPHAATGVRRILHSHAVSRSWLVIIDQFNIVCIVALKAKHDAPICPDRYRPESFQVAFQRVQPVTRQVEGPRCIRLVQTGENIFNRIQQVGSYLAAVTMLIETLETSMLKASNHLG